jgi:hypothetical protein
VDAGCDRHGELTIANVTKVPKVRPLPAETSDLARKTGGVELAVPDTFAYLIGTWALDRELTDRLTDTTGRLRGMARVTPLAPLSDEQGEEGASLRAAYLEQGELEWGEHRLPAKRRLVYLRTGTGGVDARFEDGRPFVLLDLSGGSCRALHVCGEDRYEVELSARSPALVEERWRVRGPAKRYEAVTILRREGAGTL